MSFFNFGKLGRTLLLTAVVAVGLLSVGCGGDGGGNSNPADNSGNTGGNNNGGNNNNNGNNNNGGGGSLATVSLGGLKWMKNNLNVDRADSWCYDGAAANCDKYGRLYTWESAKAACQSVGMRLPTRAEWDALVNAAGGASTAGSKLKSSTGWNSYSGISSTDEFHFSALPGGLRYTDGAFNDVGRYGYWWSATESDAGNAYNRDMNYNNGHVGDNDNDKSHGFSVRCVED